MVLWRDEKPGGIYPEPPGCKTIEKLRLEEEEKILAKREKLAARREEVRFKTAFLDMLDIPEGELSQAYFNSLSEFEKSLPRESRAFREGMQLQFTSRCGDGSFKQPRIDDTPPKKTTAPAQKDVSWTILVSFGGVLGIDSAPGEMPACS